MYCYACGAANSDEHDRCFACQQHLIKNADAAGHRFLLNGRYRILTQVGKGGFGAVYKALDTLAAGQSTDDIVAIKQIDLRGLSPQEAIEATDAFHREVSVLSNLKHPHLPRIYDHFTDPEHWYIVVDFLAGETLERYLDDATARAPSPGMGYLPFDEVLDIALQLCSVLDYLHTRHPPVIFRDLKPANIMRTPRGQLYLIDFGIARYFKPGQLKDTMPFGSPGYAAPEQYGKAQTTPQSDIYSLGALLHQLLSGEDPTAKPFRFAPLRLYGPAGVGELEALVLRMVEVEANKRPASSAEVKEELQRIIVLRAQAEPRIWRPGQLRNPQVPLPGSQASPGQTISSGVGQQQQFVPLSHKGLSRRRLVMGGLAAGAALVTGGGLLSLWQKLNAPITDPHPVYVVPAPQLTPLASISQDGRLTYRGHSGYGVSKLAWSPDGKLSQDAWFSSMRDT